MRVICRVSRIGGLPPILPLALAALRPACVLMWEIGTNPGTGCRGPNFLSPKILVIAPSFIREAKYLQDRYNQNSISKSKKLARLYQQMCKEEACEFLDASSIVTLSAIDGVHLDEKQCVLLAEALLKKINQFLK